MYDLHQNRIIALDEYSGANKKIRFKCNVCGYIWETTPHAIIKNKSGCANCSGNVKISLEELMRELNSRSDITFVGKVKNTKSKLQATCTKCGYVWNTSAYAIFRGGGCLRCKVSKSAHKLTKEEFEKRLYEKFSGKIKLSGEYHGYQKEMVFECNICNYKWNTTGIKILLTSDCPYCSNRIRLTESEFKSVIESYNKYKVIGEYINVNVPVMVECTICHKIEYKNPYELKKGVGCLYCSNKKITQARKKDHNTFIEELKNVNSNIEVLSEYENCHTKISCKCKICGNIFESVPTNLLKKHGCPICNISIGELTISKYLQDKNLKFYCQYKYKDLLGTGGRLLSYDFYIPSYNLLIEFQGEQHYRPIDYFGGEKQFKNQQEHDKRKREYAKLHNIDLLEIRYDENVDEKLNNYFNNLKLESVETVIPA